MIRPRRHRLNLLGLVVVALLAAPVPVLAQDVATPTPTPAAAMLGGNAARTGEQAGPGPAGAPVERWRISVTGLVASPAVVGDTVYVTARIRGADDVLYALDAATGGERWRLALAGSITEPAVVGETVYVGTGSGELDRPETIAGAVLALDAASGAERWRIALPGPVAAPAVANGIVYATSIDLARLATPGLEDMPPTWLVALDSASGAERWRAATGTSGFVVPLPPAVAGGVVYGLGEEVGTVVELDAATGAERWTSDFLTPIDRTWPAVTGGFVYVGASFGLHALDAASGAERWVFPEDPMSLARRGEIGEPVGSPAVAGETVYAGFSSGTDGAGMLVALEAATGRERWRVPVAIGAWTGLAIADGVVYLGDGEAVVALEAASGSERWRLDMGGPVLGSVAVADGMVYAGLLVPGVGDAPPTGAVVAIGGGAATGG